MTDAKATPSTPTAPVLIDIATNRGKMQLELYPEKAPKTVANFVSYVQDGYFNNTIFHRVIDNFMAQGGGFTVDMEQKENKGAVQNEADNGLKNTVGSIAMARTNDPHSATSQFFLNLSDNGFLDHRAKTPDGWGYCVFGKITQGLDVLKQIGKVSTTSARGHQDVPKEPVIMESVTLAGASAAAPTAPEAPAAE